MKKFFLFISIFFIFTVNSFAAVTKNTAFTKAQADQIQQIVHDYLVNNPTVLLEVAQRLQEQEKMKDLERLKQIKEKIPKFKNEIFNANNAGRTVVGNPNGKVILAVISQYLCAHCKFTSPLIENMVKNNPDLKVIIIQWPFFGNDSVYASKVALAANKQNKFTEMNHALFDSQNFLNKDEVDKIAKSVSGIDFAKLQTDMNDKAFDDALRANFKLAQDVGIIGTPTFVFANGTLTKFELVAGQTPAIEADLNNALITVKKSN